MSLISNIDDIECIKVDSKYCYYTCSLDGYKGTAKVPLSKNDNFINILTTKGIPYFKWVELTQR